MPDEEGNVKADDEPTADTPLHAYKDGRPEAVEGDPTGEDIKRTPVEERTSPDKH